MSHGAPPYTAVCPHPLLKLLLQAPPTQQAGLPPSQVRNARKLSPVAISGWSQGSQSLPTALCDITRHKSYQFSPNWKCPISISSLQTQRGRSYSAATQQGEASRCCCCCFHQSAYCLSSGVKSPPSATSPVISQTEESQDGALTSGKQVKQKGNLKYQELSALVKQNTSA